MARGRKIVSRWPPRGLHQSHQTAETIVATWEEIEAALGPILGKRGVAALYHRSLSQVASTHPWLVPPPEAETSSMDLPALRELMAQQRSDVAYAGAAALLQIFRNLLASLVGASLAERLLRSVAMIAGSTDTQDEST